MGLLAESRFAMLTFFAVGGAYAWTHRAALNSTASEFAADRSRSLRPFGLFLAANGPAYATTFSKMGLVSSGWLPSIRMHDARLHTPHAAHAGCTCLHHVCRYAVLRVLRGRTRTRELLARGRQKRAERDAKQHAASVYAMAKIAPLLRAKLRSALGQAELACHGHVVLPAKPPAR